MLLGIRVYAKCIAVIDGITAEFEFHMRGPQRQLHTCIFKCRLTGYGVPYELFIGDSELAHGILIDRMLGKRVMLEFYGVGYPNYPVVSVLTDSGEDIALLMRSRGL